MKNLFTITVSSFEQYEPSTWKCNSCGGDGSGVVPKFCPHCGLSEETYSGMHQCSELKNEGYNLLYYPSCGWLLNDEVGYSLKFMEFCPMCGLKLQEG